MNHCHRFLPAPTTRREMLMQAAHGFGGVALATMLAGEKTPAAVATGAPGPLDPKATHYRAKAKRVIFLYMDGGPSQVDTFDPKPALAKFHGQDPHRVFKVEPTQFNNIGKVLKSPWAFKRYGESGLPVSALFPTIGEHCADDLCVVRSMIAPFSEHTNANFFLHTGTGLQGRPAHGAWVAYGLGSECQDLPAYVVLNGGLIPSGGLDCFGSGFLPAAFQGSVFQPGNSPVANITPRESKPELQSAKLALIKRLDRNLLGRLGRVDQVESAIANYELAARMQMAVPDLMDLSDESKATQSLYGLDDSFANTRKYGRLCLVARRMVERGVRFIELTCTGGNGDRWDQHNRPPGGRVDPRSEATRAARRDADRVVRRVRADAVCPGRQRPGPQPLRIFDLAGRRWFTCRICPRGDRRIRIPCGRGQGRGLRPARDDAAPDGHGPQAADLSLLEPRHEADRRAWAGGARVAGLDVAWRRNGKSVDRRAQARACLTRTEGVHQAISASMTSPATSVRRKSRPL